MELKQFYENLATAFVVSYLKTPKVIKRMSCQIDGTEMAITIRKEKQGLRQCVNATIFEIRPDANKPHHMEINEIWVGYDGEGYRWSDHMGGRDVDCTGLTIDQAIDLIVNDLKEISKD